MQRQEVEGIILGAGAIVCENRTLRAEVERLKPYETMYKQLVKEIASAAMLQPNDAILHMCRITQRKQR